MKKTIFLLGLYFTVLMSSAQVTVTTLAGAKGGGQADGVGAMASFAQPNGVATDVAGNVYVADLFSNKIRKITPDGVVSTLAGTGAFGLVNGAGNTAKFTYPNAVATDAVGNVYVTEKSTRIRKISPEGVVSTLAGGIEGFANGTGVAARFSESSGVAADAFGNVYIGDSGNHKIRKITPAGVVSTLAGSTPGYADGTVGTAKFYYPSGLAIDAAGNVYVADQYNHKIRKITPAGEVTTLAGSTKGFEDGTGAGAKFFQPSGLATDAAGNVYVADSGNHRIRKITPAGEVSTVAGSSFGFVNGAGPVAKFVIPKGVATDAFGNVYVADSSNNRIRKITEVITTPIDQNFCSGATVASLVAAGSNLQWYADAIGGSAIAIGSALTSTTYYVSQTIDGVESARTAVAVTLNPKPTPTFTQVDSICEVVGSSTLPTTSLEGIIGTWSQDYLYNPTTTFTFTPDEDQCSTNTTMVIIVNPSVTPTFTQVAPICEGAILPTLPTTSLEGITGTWWSVPIYDNKAEYIFTPDNPNQCTNGNVLMTININPIVTTTFTQIASICSGEILADLPTTSIEGITGTWLPNVDNTTTTTYTFTPNADQCGTTATMTIAVNASVAPTFTQVAPICPGGSLSALPTSSLEEITGTWSPDLDNTATTTYTFTPNAGQCASTATMTVIVRNVTPRFPAEEGAAFICSGGTQTVLLTTSLEGITGTWSPAFNNLATTTYTFTPDAGQCATTATMIINVSTFLAPLFFTQVAPICAGATLSALPTTSEGKHEAIGTWSPAMNNLATTTYTFTPNAGQCAATTTMTIVVKPLKTTTFTQVDPICSGAALAGLPTFSWNKIPGSWSPAINNLVTTTYTFTPNVGQCAATATMTIVVNPATTGGTVSGATTVCRGATSGLLTLYGYNGNILRWESSTNNFVTKTNIVNTLPTYTSAPLTVAIKFRAVIQGQCGIANSESITINPVILTSPTTLTLTDAANNSSTAITNVSKYLGTNTPLILTASIAANATSYEWELPSGVTQLSIASLNSIVIDFSGVVSGTTSLYLGVKAKIGTCVSSISNNTLVPATSSTARILRVTAAVPIAPTITLTDDAINQSLAISNISKYIGTTTPLTLTASVPVNTNSYEWELPTGVNQLSGGVTNSIKINFANVVQGTTLLYIGVKSKNGVGVSTTNNSAFVPATTSTARLLRVTASVPAAVTNVSGQIAGVCGGSANNYTITPSVLANNYIITAPTGSVVTSTNNTSNASNVLSTSDLVFNVLYPANLSVVNPKTIVITAVNGVGNSLTNRTLTVSTAMPSIGTVKGSTTFRRCGTQTFTVPPILGATGYVWELVNGASIVGTSNTNTVQINFSAVPAGALTNIVKVKAVNACGVFSAVKAISLTSTSCNFTRNAVENSTTATNETTVYPNPTKGAFKLDITTLQAGTVDVEIYTINGVKVKANKTINLQEGDNTLEENISDLADGVYFVRLVNTANNEVITKRLVKE